MPPEQLWYFLPRGYAATIAIEAPMLLLLLSRGHSFGRRIFAGVWLTACTYPIVVLVLPLLIDVDAMLWLYLLVAETFAPAAECALFAAAFHAGGGISMRDRLRDYSAITLANLASFGLFELARWMRWIDW